MTRGALLRASATLIGAGLLLGGCGWFGDEADPPLPGERIAVMISESDVEPDPRLSDLTVKLPPPYLNEGWPQAGGYPDHAMHHLMAGDDLAPIWRADIGSGSDDDQRVLSGPVVAQGRIYTMDSDFEIRAFDAETGARLWRFDAEPPDEDDEAFGGGLAYADGILVATTGYAEVVAVNAADGAELWRRNLSGPIRAAATITDGRAVAITLDNQAAALDLESGEQVWSHAGFAETAGLLGAASPAISDATVIVPYSSGELFALRLGNGRVSWQENLTSTRRVDALASLADIRARPVVDRGLVYAVSHAGRMIAIDLRTGARAWDRRIGGAETPWVAGDYLFMLTTDQILLAVTRQGGRVRWATPMPRFEDEEDRDDPITWVGPVLVKDRLLIGNNLGELWSMSPYTGDPLGKIDVGSAIRIAPIVADGIVYLQTDAGDLIAYR
ncbi:MAG: PQQ-binding-like beta-propeller repeat protein [Marivibrio sp.]|uniref:outer membrane protein assembly factor BamB family protein n=1 Tax=Marivibrio sp. TaxID=2039719 RepID=UPI0032EF6586